MEGDIKIIDCPVNFGIESNIPTIVLYVCILYRYPTFEINIVKEFLISLINLDSYLVQIQCLRFRLVYQLPPPLQETPLLTSLRHWYCPPIWFRFRSPPARLPFRQRPPETQKPSALTPFCCLVTRSSQYRGGVRFLWTHSLMNFGVMFLPMELVFPAKPEKKENKMINYLMRKK